MSTKLSPDLLSGLEQLAETRGVTRSAFLHELVKAAIDRRVVFDLPASFERYSTAKNAPLVAADARIQARLVALNIRDIAEQGRKVAEVIDKANDRLQKAGVPVSINPIGAMIR